MAHPMQHHSMVCFFGEQKFEDNVYLENPEKSPQSQKLGPKWT